MNSKESSYVACSPALLAILAVLAAWISTTWLFWVGFVGADDLIYSRYAFFFHHPPMNWWEFRIPEILAIRTSFMLFGASEFTAALPNLVGSLAFLFAVGWMIGWPQDSWNKQLGMLLTAILPWDVAFRTLPAATHFAAVLSELARCCFSGELSSQLAGEYGLWARSCLLFHFPLMR